MPDGNGPRRSVFDVCFGLFIAAAMLYVAVQLVMAVFVPLLVIIGVALLIALAVWLVMWRRQGW